MSLFVQHNNGSIRRVRGTFGGNKAWKLHEDEYSGRTPRTVRLRRIEQIVSVLADEQLRDAIVDGKRQHSSKPKPVESRHPQRRSQLAAVNPTPFVETMVRPRIKVVISESGKMVAVHLD